MTRTWLKSPLAILADGAGGGVVVDNGLIAELVATGRAPSAPVDSVFDASQHVLLPGFINTHQHFWQNLTRAHPRGINRALGAWIAGLYPVWQHVDAEMHSAAAELAMTELMLSGCTTVADHHYLFPPALKGAVDSEFDIAERLGLRLVVARGGMDLGEAEGKSTPASMVERDDDILSEMERALNAHHQTHHGATRQVALAPTAAAIVSDRLMREAAALAERHDCRLHTHLGEAADEVPWCQETYGYGLVDWLAERNWLGPRTWLAHGIHFTADEAHRLGLHGVGICHCPTSNALLASGRCRTREIEAAGSPLGLGSDGGASAGAANMLEEIRHAVMVSRLTYGDAAGTTHRDALRWATEGSARCLGRTDIGRIAAGLCADFALFRMDELRLSGAHDPIAAIALVGASRADRVMIGGKWTVVDGAPVGMDVGALIARHSREARRLAEIAG